MDDAALLSIDFEKRFPYRFWYSAWFADSEHPAGCRYKLLSARANETGPVELVIAVEARGGALTEANRIEVSASAFEKTVAIYVDGLSESGKLTFFAVDLVRCRSAAAFKRILGDAGWHDGPEPAARPNP
jgi:hypothetical protein